MRLRSPVTALLALTQLVSSTPSQQVFDELPSTTSTTLIDALSADPDYSSLLALLQRALLVPTLNKLNDSTLFAPTNDAIDRNKFWSNTLQLTPAKLSLRDNVQQKLRQELLYHLLNYSILALPTENNVQFHKTLHFPKNNSYEPPPNPPWLPVPEGTLGDKPQRLRVSASKNNIWVGGDAFGQGGSKVVKGQVDTGNGMLLGINDVLNVPKDLASIVSQEPTLSYFNRILTPDVESILNSTEQLTLFLPIDEAWGALEDIERKYLESRFATDDILRILNVHAIASEGVHWSDEFQQSLNLTTISGSNIEVVVNPESHKTFVSTAELVQPDIYASNGVLHVISSLIIPPNSFTLTPEKYLLTLDCTSFVSLLHSVELESFINNTEGQYTILAPNDDVIKTLSKGELPEEGSEELRRVLSYHFLPGKWPKEKFKDSMLIETALEEPGLKGGHQVLSVDVGVDGSRMGNGVSISFGGVSVLGEPYEFNNTSIYLISRPLQPPPDALAAALPSLDLSSFLAAIFSSSLADKLKMTPRTSFLMPQNDGFKRLGLLVSNHLLQASSKSDLENVILHHVLDTVEYSSSFINGSHHSYASLEGSDVRVERLKNGTVTISSSGGWEGMSATLHTKDLLTKTGVIHELSDVLLPRSLDLTIGKLVKAAKGSTMASMIVRAGMDWVLNGTAPPDDSPWAEIGETSAGWALLCPRDEAFKGYNLTQLFEHPEVVRSIVEQHLIPVPRPLALLLAQMDPIQTNKPILLEDSTSYTTLQSRQSVYGDIVFRYSAPDEAGSTGFVVGIKDARGAQGMNEWARVLSWGRTTSNGGVGGVIQVDAVLLPYRPPWWLEYGPPVVVGVIGVGIIGIFFYGVRAYWRRDTTEATYEPVGGFSAEDDEEP